jgi:hypothetical protein
LCNIAAKFINLIRDLNSHFFILIQHMKNYIRYGFLIAGALALGSCSTSKLAATTSADDDVYNTRATAGDRPTYAQQPAYRNDNQDQYQDVTPENDYEYYYDDSYAARINRFDYASPFGYYNDYYYNSYGYAPYGGYGLGGYYGGGFGYPYGGLGYGYPYGYSGFGIGLGFGYPYGGFGYGLGWGGYGGFGYGYPYGYGGIGYGGGYGGWGVYSAYRSNPRPYLGSGIGFRNGVNTSRTGYGRPGAYSTGRTSYGGRPTTYGGRANNGGYARPQTYDNQRPAAQQPRYTPPAQSNPNVSFGGGGGFGGGRSGGGGGRSAGGRP